MNSHDQSIVCDAGPLIHLDEVGCLDLLSDFSPIWVPTGVWQEVEQHRPQALHRNNIALQKLSVDDSELSATTRHLVDIFELDLGERTALSAMRRYPQAIFLTDDAAARLAAQTLGYRVHGTIGILLRSIRRRQRSQQEVVSILQDLPARSTLHITKTLLQEVISSAQNTDLA